VTTARRTWELEKRYSQFDTLSDELREQHGETVPQLPKKTFMSLFKSKSHDEIEERRNGLEMFLTVFNIYIYIYIYNRR
jgi:hypothetical protein